MSLYIALQNALSGMNVSQQKTSITANNVSNAQTPGYSRQTAQISSRAIAGEGRGVQIDQILRQVDELLINDARLQNTLASGATTKFDMLERMQDFFGTPGAQTSLNNLVSSLSGAFEAMGLEPENIQNANDVILQADRLADKLNSISQSIQKLRAEADQRISQTVTDINAIVARLDALNGQVVRADALGQNSGDLRDARDREMTELAQLINYTSFEASDGHVVILWGGQTTLLDADPRTLAAYSPASSVGPGTTFANIAFTDPLPGENPETALSGGVLRELLYFRDTDSVQTLAELDTVALDLRDKLNVISNNASSFPPQRTLDGTRAVAAGDATAGSTGVVRISVTNSAGIIQATYDYDLAANNPATVQDVLDDINAGLAGATGVTASIVGGVLRLQANTATNGVAINENTGDLAGSGLGFSNYFGLNDLFTGTDNIGQTGDISSTLAVRSTILADANLLPRAVLSLTAVATEAGLSVGDGSAVEAMASYFTASQSFAASGSLPAMTRSIADYTSAILAGNALKADRAETEKEDATTLKNEIEFRAENTRGVNVDEEMALLIELQNAFQANARVISIVQKMFDELSSIV